MQKLIFEAVVVFFWASEYCHSPYFTPYLNSLGFGATLTGLIVGCYGATQLVCRIPLGIVTDVTGKHKRMIQMGLFFTTLSSFGLWLFTDVRLIFLFRMFAGIAVSTWIVMTTVYMSFYPPEESVKATATLNALNSGGKLLAFVAGFAAARLFDYRTTLFCSFAAGAVGMVLLFFLKEESVRIPVKEVSFRDILNCVRSSSLLYAAVLAGVNMMIMHGTVYSFTSTIAQDLGAGAMMLSLLSVIFAFVQIAGAPFLKNNVISKGKTNLSLLAAFLLSALYLVMLGLAQNIGMILAAQVIAGLANAIANSLLTSECVKEIEPGCKTIAMGAYQALYSIGMTLGPIYMGRSIEVFGSRTACLILAGISALTAILAGVSRTENSKMIKYSNDNI